ncbi:MAG: hypothetical protein GY679_03955 [Mycoplasma sp.]|nr:hypothetical protein [Mycoplasma sp.]
MKRKNKLTERKPIRLYILKHKLWTVLFFLYIVGYFVAILTLHSLGLNGFNIPKEVLFHVAMIPVYTIAFPMIYLGVHISKNDMEIDKENNKKQH